MTTKKPAAKKSTTTAKSKSGRPTLMTRETIALLEQAFQWGCGDLEACMAAGINKQTLYNYQAKHPEYVDRKAMLKQSPQMKARRVISQSLDEGDVNTANKVIDRIEGLKVKLSGEDGGAIKHEWTIAPVTTKTAD